MDGERSARLDGVVTPGGGGAAEPVRAATRPEPGGPDALFRAWRARIASTRRHGRPADQPAGSDFVGSSLAQAAAVAEPGSTVPDFAHLSLPRRLVARATGRLLIYFLRLITVDQHHFNRLALAALRGLVGEAGDLHRRLDTMAAELRPRLEQAHSECRALEDALAAVRQEVAQVEQALTEHGAMLAELRTAAFRLTHRGGGFGALGATRAGNGGSIATGDARPNAVEIDRRLVADTFRGAEAEVAERQRRYLRYFHAADRPVLDLGCGRGEFLRLLAEAGIRAYGIDLDDDLALWCQEKGLDVQCGDGLDHLAGLEDGQLGGIFCAQVVEHLLTDDVLRLVDLAHRKLRPGAALIIETLNPESLLVLYRWFWMDLTHQRLVHPETLKIVLRACGFEEVAIEFVPPPDGPRRIPPLRLPGDAEPALDEFNGATQYLNELLYASFDYAAIAVR